MEIHNNEQIKCKTQTDSGREWQKFNVNHLKFHRTTRFNNKQSNKIQGYSPLKCLKMCNQIQLKLIISVCFVRL